MTHLFRSHSLAEIMADPVSVAEHLQTAKVKAVLAKKKRTDEEKALIASLKDATLSEGAKTHIRKIAKQILFGVPSDAFKVDNKYLSKGLACENSAIALLNTVRGSSYAKNTERRENQWISGEPDIVADDHGVDIKCSWSIDTFPLTAEEGEDKTYEWQCRAYMMLFDRPRWEIAYCLVDTPDNLLGYEDWRLHKVSHIPAVKRVTTVLYERDTALEDKIKVKCDVALEYLNDLLVEIGRRHELLIDLNPKASAVETATPVAPQPRTMSAAQAFAS